jgi:hypothetical protein
MYLGNVPDAEAAFTRAIALLPPGDHLTLAGLTLQTADTFMRRFLLEACQRSLDQALEILGAVRDESGEKLQLEIQLMRMSLFYYLNLPEKMEALAPQIQPLLDRYGSAPQNIQFLALIDQIHLRQHRYRILDAQILANEAEAFRIALQSDNPVLIGERHFANGMMLWFRGALLEAASEFERGLALAREMVLASLENQCLVYLLVVLRKTHAAERVQELLPRCQQVAGQAQNLTYLGAARAHAAWLALQEGDKVLARTEGEAALSWWQKTPSYPFQWLAYVVLFDLELAEGNLEAARQAVKHMHALPQQWLGDEIHAAFDQVGNSAAISPELAESLRRARQVLVEAGYL